MDRRGLRRTRPVLFFRWEKTELLMSLRAPTQGKNHHWPGWSFYDSSLAQFVVCHRRKAAIRSQTHSIW